MVVGWSEDQAHAVGTLLPVTSPDCAFGVFTDHGPWVIDPDDLAWKAGLARIRADTIASVPELIRARKFPPGAGWERRFATWGCPGAVVPQGAPEA